MLVVFYQQNPERDQLRFSFLSNPSMSYSDMEALDSQASESFLRVATVNISKRSSRSRV